MWTLPNMLSLTRLFLSLVFLQENIWIRCVAIGLAALTDSLDGFLARRQKTESQWGAFLDPLADKCFVIAALFALVQSNGLSTWQVMSILGRDLAVLTYGILLLFKGRLRSYQFHSLWAGKVTTTLQFVVLVALTCHIVLPSIIFISLLFLGIAAFFELLFLQRPEALS